MVTKQKILIVDDDENIAELISLYLTKECFDTKMVHDGEKALLAYETYQPNLILLDLMLPGIDGYQVCREIRRTSNIPIIMLTAKGGDMDKILGLEYGADDYITKPFNILEVKARIKAIMRRAGADHETQVQAGVRPPSGGHRHHQSGPLSRPQHPCHRCAGIGLQLLLAGPGGTIHRNFISPYAKQRLVIINQYSFTIWCIEYNMIKTQIIVFQKFNSLLFVFFCP